MLLLGLPGELTMLMLSAAMKLDELLDLLQSS